MLSNNEIVSRQYLNSMEKTREIAFDISFEHEEMMELEDVNDIFKAVGEKMVGIK